MSPLPNLRSVNPDRRIDPAFDRRTELGRRESDLCRREAALAEYEACLRAREDAAAQCERRLELATPEPEVAANLTNVTPLDRRTPQQIRALADAVIRAGQNRRGELVDDVPEPRTEAERLAARVIEAGKRRRGEID